MSVRSPRGLNTTPAGDLPLAIRNARKRPDIDLERARFVRLVRKPVAVRRDLAIQLVCRVLEQQPRGPPVIEWQEPQMALAVRCDLPEDQLSAVRSDRVGRHGANASGVERLAGSGPVRGFADQSSLAAVERDEHESLSVACP